MSHEFSHPKTHLDLFSGIGGFALAASWTGWRTIAFAEIESFPSEVLSRRFDGIPNLGDVTKLCRRIHDCERIDDDLFWCPKCDIEFGDCACIGTDQFLDEIGWPELITGGVPCQPASLIGERRGTADERWLWPEVLRIMGQLRPRFGLFENPSAILSLESGRAFNGILSGLASLGMMCCGNVFPQLPLVQDISGNESGFWLPTPTARDWKDTPGMAKSKGDRNRTDQLPRRIYALEESKAKSGIINPAFSLWLMGFPPDWLDNN